METVNNKEKIYRVTTGLGCYCLFEYHNENSQKVTEDEILADSEITWCEGTTEGEEGRYIDIDFDIKDLYVCTDNPIDTQGEFSVKDLKDIEDECIYVTINDIKYLITGFSGGTQGVYRAELKYNFDGEKWEPYDVLREFPEFTDIVQKYMKEGNK